MREEQGKDCSKRKRLAFLPNVFSEAYKPDSVEGNHYSRPDVTVGLNPSTLLRIFPLQSFRK